MTDKNVCVHCNSRNTAHLEGLTHECHDCGKTYGVPALIQASGKNEFDDNITHIEVSLHAGLLKRVAELREAVVKAKATYISEFHHVDAFNGDEEVRVDCVLLVVDDDGFHYEGNYKHSSGEWYTPDISLDGKKYEEWEADE